MSRTTVLVFVRAPRRGEVKTRLAADVGPDAALQLYRRMAEHSVARAREVEGATVRVHYTPADAGAEVAAWLGNEPEYRAQSVGDLGERMRSAVVAAFADGFGRVVIVGSDLPGLTTQILRAAFAELEAHDAVLGPARDGGYYLLGLRRMLPGIFREIPWSTDRVLALTLERLRERGIRPALLPVLGDVDTIEDLPPEWREGISAEV